MLKLLAPGVAVLRESNLGPGEANCGLCRYGVKEGGAPGCPLTGGVQIKRAAERVHDCHGFKFLTANQQVRLLPHDPDPIQDSLF